MSPAVDPEFAARLRELMAVRGISYRALAARTYHGKSYLNDLANGRKPPTVDVAARVDAALDAGGELLALATGSGAHADAQAAAELARRVASSDVSEPTLAGLERAVDELAIGYARLKPAELLPRVRDHLGYVTRLVEARTTLSQRRRLIVVGGWLQLLAATLHIDLHHRSAAASLLASARDMAEFAEHRELVAWTVETQAWDVLVEGRFAEAVRLSLEAQELAPRDSSVFIQATAQEGRAWARMGRVRETLDALNRTTKLVSPLPMPDEPEHHYRYDPGKALAYTATTLSWIGDPAAVGYARDVVTHMDGAERRPRRAALARLDLSLALARTGRPDEAGELAVDAISSGLLVPSTWWRATEVVEAIVAAGVPQAAAVRDAYQAFRPAVK